MASGLGFAAAGNPAFRELPQARPAPCRALVPQAELERLVALHGAGRFAEVLWRIDKLAARHARSLMLCNVEGAACIALGRFAKAEAAFRAAIGFAAGHAELHNNLGAALEPQGKLDEAIAAYEQALALRPDYASAHYNLGNVLRKRNALAEAVACYERAIALRPDYADAHNNLGLAVQQLGRVEDAIAHYGQALALKPDSAETLYNLGTALTDLRDHAAAIEAFDLVLALRPDHAAAARQVAFARMQLCDFSAQRAFPPLRDEGAGGADAVKVPPFIMLGIEDDPQRQFACSRAWARTALRPSVPPHSTARREGRIRLGYFSADFHDHATLCLMAGLFREHDRERFEVIAYSYGPDSADAMRADLIGNVDRFVDIRELSDREAVRLVHGHELDIAVDLKGYTKDSRSHLFASRLAPVQMNYLGYPGSIGAEFMDYLIADAVVVPEDCRRFYSEKIVSLPGSYQPNDDRRPIAATGLDRAAAGLPEDGFVFCCFNQAYKIGPAEFAIWMRLLDRVPGSVLWLLRPNPSAEANLRREAEGRGVDPDRLVFADHLPNAEHLARLRLADLFLDTFHYNAHTTASDALWAGLPVVTRAGRQFAARVGASLLHATGLPDLVTTSDADYEALAAELAEHPAKLAAIRARLTENRLTEPLFDTRRYARAIEAAYVAAHHRRLDGLAPALIEIA